MKKKIFSIWSVLLVLVVSIAVVIPGCDGAACTGDIEVKATLCDAAWNGSVQYTLTLPGATAPTIINGTSVNATHSDVDCGNWTCEYVSGGPPGAYLVDITPPSPQEVTSGGTITFTLNFELDQDAWIAIDELPWTLNGVPIPPYIPPDIFEHDAFLCDVIDVHFWQGVLGCKERVVAVNETSWLMIHLVSYTDNFLGPIPPLGPVQLYVVNELCAVNKTVEQPPPGPPEKVSQKTTLGDAYINPGEYIDLYECQPVEVDVETIWMLEKEVDYLKSINWFGISLSPFAPGGEHECVLFELIVPPSFGTGGMYHFQLQAMAELELMDDVDVNLNNNHAVTPMLDLYVIVP